MTKQEKQDKKVREYLNKLLKEAKTEKEKHLIKSIINRSNFAFSVAQSDLISYCDYETHLCVCFLGVFALEDIQNFDFIKLNKRFLKRRKMLPKQQGKNNDTSVN